MASRLPNVLIVEILSRLPSKSLLRFRSVCKSWLSLISSTEFRHNKEVYTVHLDDQQFTLDAEAPIKFPFKIVGPDIYCYTIIGCCNGVVCLCNDNTTEEVILWNPSVRRNITLVPSIFPNNYWYKLILVLGFGYDTMSDDYKVVRVAYDGLFFARPHVSVALHKLIAIISTNHDYLFTSPSQVRFTPLKLQFGEQSSFLISIASPSFPTRHKCFSMDLCTG
ncbi:F-box domain, cyclin-like protein [Cynara cardunculus var. scolymus]|uniref:F-box domain, cyclin-like protein n=1 Tax=Cynara cardunculus var. scolymus TaxID=59895 RepID=A0A103Y192_CYNCS|nr:F-box domain, cyclin-like protein [Cynara cardunculus var. scolymus]